MKRMVLISVVLVLGLFLVTTAQAGRVVDPTGSWSTPDDFTTKFWKEKFFGGAPGQPRKRPYGDWQGVCFSERRS